MGQSLNILLIVVWIILAVFTLWGYWRGFIRVAFSLAALVVMALLVSWLSPYMDSFLREHTPLEEKISGQCVAMVQEMAREQVQAGAEERLAAAESQGGIQLPAQWGEALAQKTAGALDQALEETGIYQEAGMYLADMILRGISFGATFLLVAIVLKIVIHLLDLVARLPVLKGINRILGAVAGLAEGLLAVWVLLFIVTLACTSPWGQQALASIQESKFLTFLYQNNGIVYLVGRIFG